MSTHERSKLLLQAKESVCALNEKISFVSFFDQRKERFEGNIYNTQTFDVKKLPIFKAYIPKQIHVNKVLFFKEFFTLSPSSALAFFDILGDIET